MEKYAFEQQHFSTSYFRSVSYEFGFAFISLCEPSTQNLRNVMQQILIYHIYIQQYQTDLIFIQSKEWRLKIEEFIHEN